MPQASNTGTHKLMNKYAHACMISLHGHACMECSCHDSRFSVAGAAILYTDSRGRRGCTCAACPRCCRCCSRGCCAGPMQIVSAWAPLFTQSRDPMQARVSQSGGRPFAFCLAHWINAKRCFKVFSLWWTGCAFGSLRLCGKQGMGAESSLPHCSLRCDSGRGS